MGLVVINRIVCEEVTKEMSVAFYHCLEWYRKYKKSEYLSLHNSCIKRVQFFKSSIWNIFSSFKSI